jgi:serine protease
MKKGTLSVIVMASALLFWGCEEYTPGQAEGSTVSKIVNDSSSSENGTLLVRFKDGEDVPSEIISGSAAISLEPLFSGSGDASLKCWFIARFSAEIPSESIAGILSEREDVDKIQYNKIIRENPSERMALPQECLTPSTRSSSADKLIFNDTNLSDQWHLINTGNTNICKTAVEGADISVKDAWRLTGGDPSIVVAIIDEGVMYNHPDLAANFWTNETELNGEPGVDDDGNGFIDDVHGYNFASDKPEISWNKSGDSGHGTHVAGTVAAVNNNGIGVCGVAGGTGNGDGVRLMSCQIFDGSTSSSASVARAFMYAADNGATVAQCSFGYDAGEYKTDEEFKKRCSAEYAGIEYFLSKTNCHSDVVDGNIIIFSAGNNSKRICSYPGGLKDVVSVTAFGPGYQPAGYTNYGTGCNISAPGGDYYVGRAGYNKKCQVLSTIPGSDYTGDYGWMEGTSMATPHVSGVVALGLSYAKKLGLKFSREEFISMLLTSVNGIDSYFTGTKPLDTESDMELSYYIGNMGTGAVDAWKLLMNIEGTPSFQLQIGTTDLDLTELIGAQSAVLNNIAVEMDEASRSSMGVSGDLKVAGNTLSINCTKPGSGYLTVTADSQGIPITRKISIICRAGISENGGWL